MTEGLLPWLHRVRALAGAAQLVLLLVAFGTGERPIVGAVLLVVVAALELARRAAPEVRAPLLVAGLDVVAVGAFVASWAEPHQPLQVFWLVQVALVASFAPRSAAVGFAVFTCAVDALTLLPAAFGLGPGSDPPVHLVAHAATFALGAAALTGFLASASEASRASESALREAQVERARDARLAAVGALAAGVAHELATPLGSIELLAEELRDDPAALEPLRGQLARCRGILDRLLARGGGDDRTERPAEQVAAWVAEWRAAHGGHPVALRLDDAPAAAGSPEGWRSALWTVLDNALRAGPPIEVALAPGPDRWRLQVSDRGPGVAPEVATRLGEPFVSGWGGAGLGLFAARTFARGAGGDLALQPRDGGGTCVTLELPRAAPDRSPT